MSSPSLSKQTLIQSLEEAYQKATRESSVSALAYLNHVVIDSRPEPKAFRLVAEPWQWALAQRVLPALESVTQVNKLTYQGPRSFWFTLPKGHDKSSFIGRMANWCLAFTRIRLNAYVAAKDKEQAGYLAEAMEAEAKLNPWICPERIQFRNWKVDGQQDSFLKVLAADAAGAQGVRGDLLIFDELSQWDNDQFFYNCLSGREKRPDCVMIVITNAGTKYSWQWNQLQEAKKLMRETGSWYVYEAPPFTQLASWMSQTRVAELKRQILPQLARQLFDNCWTDPSEGSGYISRPEVEYCEELGRLMGLVRRDKGEPNKDYVASIDYGAVKDRCVLAVGHLDDCDGFDQKRILIDKMDVWQGTRERPIQIESVERWIDETRQAFPLSCLVIDPHQMQGTIQRYQGQVPIEVYEARGGKANYVLAEALRGAIVNQQLAWYPDCGVTLFKGQEHTLVDEISELICVFKAYGYRIDHLPGRHDDRAVCLGQLVTNLLRVRPRRRLYLGEHFF